MRTLFFRADADSRIGTGHVMRCLAIAQAWLDRGGKAVFLMRQARSGIRARVEREGASIIELGCEAGTSADAEQTVRQVAQRERDWLVVDGYQFGGEYQDVIKSAGLKLLFLDDCGHCSHYSADLVLNQNLHANESLYARRNAETELLLGAHYALLRREFLRWKEWTRTIPDRARKLLVTLGGSDPDNVTEHVIEALKSAGRDLQTTILVGASNPRYRQLQQAAAGLERVSMIENASNMAERMAEADMAVAGAGSTCWELCFLGLPAIVIDLAENQRPVSRELQRLGAAVDLGDAAEATSVRIAEALSALVGSRERRTAMSAMGRSLIDGRGASRVCQDMESRGLRLRRAGEGDCKLLWDWANDPEIRASAFSPEPIPWESHVSWFRARLADRASLFFIALNAEDVPVGQVRYHLESDRAVLSVNMDRQFRGKGYARRVLALANQKLFETSDAKFIDAYVKPENAPSLRAFGNAGFRRIGTREVKGEEAVHFVLERNGIHS